MHFSVLYSSSRSAGSGDGGRGLGGGPAADFLEEELIGLATLRRDQFYPRGFDAALTVSHPKRGIRGTLWVRVRCGTAAGGSRGIGMSSGSSRPMEPERPVAGRAMAGAVAYPEPGRPIGGRAISPGSSRVGGYQQPGRPVAGRAEALAGPRVFAADAGPRVAVAADHLSASNRSFLQAALPAGATLPVGGATRSMPLSSQAAAPYNYSQARVMPAAALTGATASFAHQQRPGPGPIMTVGAQPLSRRLA